MYRFILSAMFILSATTTWAAFNPEIGYTSTSGKTNNVYLANQDGSNAVRIYNSNKSISDIDIAPGGGRVAFVEAGVLKVLSYSVVSSNVTVNSVITLDSASAGSPDFSPDGSKIIYTAFSGTSQIRLISSSGGTPKILLNLLGSNLSYMSSGDRFVYSRMFPASTEVHLVVLDGNDDVISNSTVINTASEIFKGIEDLSAAKTKNSLLISADFPSSVSLIEYNLDTNTYLTYASGVQGSFSQDDSQILYLDASRSILKNYDIASHTSVNLSKKGNYNFTDWMP